jgi:hypothetical protein
MLESPVETGACGRVVCPRGRICVDACVFGRLGVSALLEPVVRALGTLGRVLKS